MSNRKALTRIAKAVVADLASQRMSDATARALRALDEEPRHLFDLVDLMANEAKKKRPSERLISGYVFLLGHGLEVLRYAVEREDAPTIALVAHLREHIIQTTEKGRMPPAILLLILHQFASAKLEMGDELRDLMQTMLENDSEARAACERGEGADHFARLVEQFDGDPFAIHTYLDEMVEAMPADGRVGLIMAMFAETEPAIREAAVGFLLTASAEARGKLVELLEQAAPHGLVTPTMLRRMIAMRNWLPASERSGLDQAIKSARKTSIECASWPRPVVRQVVCSGVDGSGAFTLLIVAEEAGKALVVGLLIKQGFGIRDAWVRRDVGTTELREIFEHVASEIELAETSLDYAKLVCCQALAINLDADHSPPFALLDCAEATGLTDLNPKALPVDKLVADLLSEVDEKRLSKAAVTKTLHQSADWLEENPTLETWFEDSITSSIGSRRTPRSKQLAFLLAGPLQARRRRWAELAAWTALSLKHRRHQGDWQAFTILARELLADTPLDQIGLMMAIADTTLVVLEMKGLLGTRHAA